jgi:hypothetical protein
VDEATGGATEPVTNEVRKISDENLGPVDDAVGGVTDEVAGREAPSIGGGRTNGSLDDRVLGQQNSRRNATTNDGAGGGTGGFTQGRPIGTEIVPQQGPDRASAGSVVQQAGELAKEIAFPLALLLMVGAFLAIQSRWDKQDPKLAMAPVDVDEQYLSFR